nr:hypothetical protein [Parasutterella excrementihominis]
MHIKKCFTAIFISSAFLSAGLVNSHAAEAPVQQQKVEIGRASCRERV